MEIGEGKSCSSQRILPLVLPMQCMALIQGISTPPPPRCKLPLPYSLVMYYLSVCEVIDRDQVVGCRWASFVTALGNLSEGHLTFTPLTQPWRGPLIALRYGLQKR